MILLKVLNEQTLQSFKFLVQVYIDLMLNIMHHSVTQFSEYKLCRRCLLAIIDSVVIFPVNFLKKPFFGLVGIEAYLAADGKSEVYTSNREENAQLSL
jgi:hypothetical protein